MLVGWLIDGGDVLFAWSSFLMIAVDAFDVFIKAGNKDLHLHDGISVVTAGA